MPATSAGMTVEVGATFNINRLRGDYWVPAFAGTTATMLVKRKKPSRFREGLFVFDHRVEEISVFGRPGSDLLFQALRLSIIGAGEFNGRVRDGIGYRLLAETTRPAKDGMKQAVIC